MNTKRILAGFAQVLAMAMVGCGEHSQEGGTSFETGNAVSGRAVGTDGAPHAGILVRIRPYWHLGDGTTPLDDPRNGFLNLVTDSAGYFHARSLPPGRYRIELRGSDRGILSPFELESRSGTKDLGSLEIKPLSQLSGHVPGMSQATGLRLRIHGTDHVAAVDENGRFVLSEMPYGSVRMVATPGGSDSSLAEASAFVPPGGSSDIGALLEDSEDPLTWKHQRDIELRTDEGGFPYSQGAKDVPVLLRLDNELFPVEALPDGRDLRVVDSAYRPVPFETMLWDPATKNARIWIRIDSIQAHSVSRSARILWGRAASRSRTASQAVWDSLAGWSGVWHLAGSYTDPQGRRRVPDATAHGMDAIVVGDHRDASNPGDIPSHYFDGRTDVLRMGGGSTEFGDRSFTLELWVRPSAVGASLLSKGVSQADPGMKQIYLGSPVANKSSLGWYPTYNLRPDTTRMQWGILSKPLDSTTWSHLTLRMTPSTTNTAEVLVDWYLNGMRIDSTLVMCKSPDRRTDSIAIGNVLAGSTATAFSGWMAELRVSRVARSDAWIRLTKEAQTPGTRLIRYLPIP